MSDDVSTIPNPGFRGSRAGRYGMGPQPRSNRLDPEMKKMMLIAGGLGAVLAGFFGISALRGHHSEGVPVITADTRPIRVKPDNPGGMKIEGLDTDLFSGGSDTANARLAPAAEAPDTKALRAEESTPPAPAAQAPAEPSTSAPLAALPQHPPAVPAPKAAPQATTPAVQSKPLVLAGLASPTAKPPPAPLPRASAEVAAPTARPAAPLVQAPRPAAPPAAKPASGKAAVQLAALGTEEAAHAEWQQLTKRMPELLNGRQPVFTRTERDGKVFWRVRLAGFNDAAAGRSFCEQVRAKGGGCSIAEF